LERLLEAQLSFAKHKQRLRPAPVILQTRMRVRRQYRNALQRHKSEWFACWTTNKVRSCD